MSLILPLVDRPPEHPTITALKARFARKGERAVVDPAFRATLETDWWTQDWKHIRDESRRLKSDGRLDPQKSSVELPHSDDYDQRWRFRRWPIERSFWLQNIQACETSDRRIQRFEDCGRKAHIWHDETEDRLFVRSDTCKLRICPACRRRYQFAAIQRIRDLLAEMRPKTWQFITLTVRHTARPLREQTDFLKASFRRLRQRKLWKSSVLHGYAVLEVTFNKHRNEWHPHLHVLARVRFLDWRQLRKDWIGVTDGSSVIDCGYVRNEPSACDYVAKYLGKPPSLLDLPDIERVAEYYQAMQNTRFLMPFGKPPRAPTRPTLDTPRKLTPLGSLTSYHVRSRQGDLEAATLLRKLAHQFDAPSQVTEPEHRHSIAAEASSFDPADPLTPT